MDIEEFDEIVGEMRSIIERKNSDYAATIDNISLTGLHGVAVRLLDKVARVHSLASRNAEPKVNESLRDTFLDIANYAIIGTMLVDGTWAKNQQKSVTPEKSFAVVVGSGGGGGGGSYAKSVTGGGVIACFGGAGSMPETGTKSVPKRPVKKSKKSKKQ